MKIRHYLTILCAVTVLCGSLTSLSAQSSEGSIDLIPNSSTSQVVRVQMRLEGKGTVIATNEQEFPLKVDGQFRYDERIIARSKMLKSIRSYDIAQARITSERTIVNKLPKSSVIIAQTQGIDEPVRLASVGRALSQEQFELINTPANTLLLAEVFKKVNIQKGKSWKPSDLALARLLNIDSIQNSDVEIRFDSVQGNEVILFISGDAGGTIDGSNTDIAISGSARFNTRQGIVSRCDLTLTQQRDIGLLAPGLDAVFKIAMRVQPIADSKVLSNDGLAKLKKQAGRITDSLSLQATCSPTSLLHPRDWRLISNNKSRAILRFIEEGRMLGQCDIIPLPNRITTTPQTLEQFQQVVLNGIDDENARVISTNQLTVGDGIDVLKVAAQGQASGVDLIWIYYTLTHQDGRRVQMVFTTEPGQQKQFAGSDQSLIESLQFNEATSPTRNAGFSKSK